MPIKLVFVQNRNKKREWLAILSTDLTLEPNEIVRIYGMRWSIETFFKVTKSYLKLGAEFQDRSFDMLISHTTIVFSRYLVMEYERRQTGDPRTLGGLFFMFADEVCDLDYQTALRQLMSLFIEMAHAENKPNKQSVWCQLQEWMADLPLYKLYNYDFTEYENTDANEYGYFGFSHTDDLWNDHERYPYFIRVDGKFAGFVLVHNHCRYTSCPNAHNIDEFSVMLKYRRKGVGRYAAKAIFDLFRGEWEILQMPNNIRAQKFWKSVISEYTNCIYQECGSMNEEWVGFLFDKS